VREKISACVITFNEERKIARCLRSLAWCDEIVILDSFSTDRTLEICREFSDRIFQHEWMGYVGQRNLVREKAVHSWLLFLDADEEVSPGLRADILREFEKGTGKYVGFEFPRLGTTSDGGSGTASGTRTSNCGSSRRTSAARRARSRTTRWPCAVP